MRNLIKCPDGPFKATGNGSVRALLLLLHSDHVIVGVFWWGTRKRGCPVLLLSLFLCIRFKLFSVAKTLHGFPLLLGKMEFPTKVPCCHQYNLSVFPFLLHICYTVAGKSPNTTFHIHNAKDDGTWDNSGDVTPHFSYLIYTFPYHFIWSHSAQLRSVCSWFSHAAIFSYSANDSPKL